MKQYLLAVQFDESAPSPSEEEIQEQQARTAKVTAEMQSAGSWVFVGGLLPSHASTVVRPHNNGTTTMTDGPFAETKEQLGGFWVIQCDDLDQALAWAEKCALACGCPIEVRPFNDGSGE